MVASEVDGAREECGARHLQSAEHLCQTCCTGLRVGLVAAAGLDAARTGKRNQPCTKDCNVLRNRKVFFRLFCTQKTCRLILPLIHVKGRALADYSFTNYHPDGSRVSRGLESDVIEWGRQRVNTVTDSRSVI